MTFQEAFELSQKWHEHNLTMDATATLIRDIEQRTKFDAVARIREACQLKCGDRESVCECQRYINAVNGVFEDDAVQGGDETKKQAGNLVSECEPQNPAGQNSGVIE